MFCTKCGTQLPDGAIFCTSCGNQLNTQPTAPIMPVEPVTPAMNAPIINEPIMPVPAPVMDDPIMPAPSMDIPGFNQTNSYPANQYSYNTGNNIPGNTPTNATPKKSKAPIFVGLGIGAIVIAIIAIILVLFLTGGDDKDKKSKNKSTGSSTKVETTTDDEATTSDEDDTEIETEDDTEDETEDETDTPDIDAALYEGMAETAVSDFLKYLEEKNYTAAANYILPALVETCESTGLSKEQLAEQIAASLSDPNGNLVSYEISLSFINDRFWFTNLIDELMRDGYDLEKCSSFKEPITYANVLVDFEYNDQLAFLTFYVAYIDDQFYIFEYTDEDFDIDFDVESESESESDSASSSGDSSATDFDTSLATNYKNLTLSVKGTLYEYDNYNVTYPDTWAASDELGYSADGDTFVIFAHEDADPTTNMNELKELYNNSCMEDNFEFGNITINNKQGYYIEYDAEGLHSFICIFFNSTGDKAYMAAIGSYDINSDSYAEALGIIASMELK